MADAEMAEPGHDAIALPPTTSTRSSLVPEDGNSITTSSTTLALTRSKKTPAKRNQKSMKGSGANRTPKSAKLSPNKVTKRKPKPSKAKVDKEEPSNPEPSTKEHTNSFEDDADGDTEEAVEDEEEQEDYAYDTGGREDPLSIPKEKRSKWKTKGLKPDPNGRFVGRKLVMWHRPRMMEKLMLHVQYECQRQGVQIPWDKVVHRLSPGSSGATAQQHLNKLRDQLVTEGHMVPPLIGKLGVPAPDAPRGYIRDMTSDDPHLTKEVFWSDHVEDRKESLIEPGIIRGSGAYRKYEVEVKTHVKRTLSKFNIKDEPIPEDLAVIASKPFKYEGVRKGNTLRPGSGFHKTKYAGREEPSQKVNPRGAAKRGNLARSKQAEADIDDLGDEKGTASSARAGKAPSRKPRPTRSTLVKEEEEEEEDQVDEIDPAEQPSDDDYNPGKTIKSEPRSRRSRRKPVKYSDAIGSDADAVDVTPTKSKTLYDSDEPMTPPGTDAKRNRASPVRGKESVQTKLSRTLYHTSMADNSDSEDRGPNNVSGLDNSPSAMRHGRMYPQDTHTGFVENDFTQSQFAARRADMSENGDFQNAGSTGSYSISADSNEKHLGNLKVEKFSPQKMSGALDLFAGGAEDDSHGAVNTLFAPSQVQPRDTGMMDHFPSVDAHNGRMVVALHETMLGVSPGSITPVRSQPQLLASSPATLRGNHGEMCSELEDSERAFDGGRGAGLFHDTMDNQGHTGPLNSYHSESVERPMGARGSFDTDSTNATSMVHHDHTFDGLPTTTNGGGFGFGWNGELDDVFNDNTSYPRHAEEEQFHLWGDMDVDHHNSANYTALDGNFEHDFGV